MRQAPQTSLGTDNKFAHVDNDLKRPGDLLVYKFYQISMSSLSDAQKRKKLRRADGSSQAKQIQIMKAKFRKNVKAVRKMVLRRKQK